jgi:hypothetical protein
MSSGNSTFRVIPRSFELPRDTRTTPRVDVTVRPKAYSNLYPIGLVILTCDVLVMCFWIATGYAILSCLIFDVNNATKLTDIHLSHLFHFASMTTILALALESKLMVDKHTATVPPPQSDSKRGFGYLITWVVVMIIASTNDIFTLTKAALALDRSALSVIELVISSMVMLSSVISLVWSGFVIVGYFKVLARLSHQ